MGKDPGLFDNLRCWCTLSRVNIGVRASYWRFIKAPGGADKAQR
jgi:hypothetical protein